MNGATVTFVAAKRGLKRVEAADQTISGGKVFGSRCRISCAKGATMPSHETDHEQHANPETAQHEQQGEHDNVDFGPEPSPRVAPAPPAADHAPQPGAH